MNNGMIELIIGPMFSGKSSELLRRLTRYKIAGKQTLLLRPQRDTRGFFTHDKKENSVKEFFLENISDFKDLYNYDVIGIDEGQFFSDLKIIDKWADMGITVIVSALNGTSEKKTFSSVQDLIPISDQIDKLSAVCTNCGDDAQFSFYKVGNKENDIVVGEDEYTALCRKCWNEKSNMKSDEFSSFEDIIKNKDR
ncbi:hypothetical protein EW093_01755 [Thiospirochaeta perfilievii]|uniref:Thymidine kinase n=2 Tax=Thiospirochaeta perfilievii TaxID=252967 RepID=A0A5C1Q7R3_9SPIO|nr:hypothetical protein EW093_01755 [Thiospirochaeta perfilievii]